LNRAFLSCLQAKTVFVGRSNIPVWFEYSCILIALRGLVGETIIAAMALSTKPEHVGADRASEDQMSATRVFSAVAWTGLSFAFLQSVCTVLIGLGGARLLISLVSFAAASSVFTRMDAFHRDGLRIPMMIFACVGALLNLIVVAQVRRLRNRPSARWRIDVSAVGVKMRQERWQIVLSVVTLVLVVVEEVFHRMHVHSW
jgi:hypothetical protein